jgi:DivIVA domain-containing protein
MERFWRDLFSRFAQAERQETSDEFPLDVLYPKENEDVEMTSYYIRSRRFGRTLLGGFRPEEVTAFLDEIAEALQTAQRLHLEAGAQVKLLEEQIQARAIKQPPGAPSDAPEGVQRHATSMSRHEEQTDDAPAASRLEVLRNTTLQEVEALLHDAQARTQALTEAARKEADQVIADATVTADSILRTARDEEAALRHELDRLAESRLRMLDDVWATLNGCREWLATVDPRRRAPDEPEGRLDRVA